MSRAVSCDAAGAARSIAVRRHHVAYGVSLVTSLLLVAVQHADPAMGTTGQAYLVKDIWSGSPNSFLSGFTEVNGVLFFAADDGVRGVELWKSDGTEGDTAMVKDIGLGFGSEPGNLTNLDGTLFFAATDVATGRELWKSDGTAAGTLLVKDIPPTGFSSSPTDLTPFNHQLFFSAARELWKSDGTTAGTIRVRDFPGSGGAGPSHLTSANGILFFAAFDPATGSELWKSDGTTAGTVLVKDINPGIDVSNPVSLVNVNGTLFFLAFDGTHGVELWKSDGTTEGTVLVKDIYPGSESGLSSFSAYLTNVEGTLFFAANDGVHGVELWKSDGTDAGTVLVKDIFPGGPFSWSNPSYLTALNGAVYFAALEFTLPFSLNVELWRSDGTESGTFRVKDINPGPLPSSPQRLVAINGILFFSAGDDVHGQELWKSDGTEAGTELVDDIVPGLAGSLPRLITLAGSHVFFAANDFVVGEELWATAAPPAPPPGCSTDADCDDGNVCTVNRCLNGACDFSQPVQCDDGNACNGVETCDPVSGCRAGLPPQEVCTGGLDEDCDGLTDCADTECTTDPLCAPLIFTGVFGGSLFELRDDPSRAIATWIDMEVADFVKDRVPGCADGTCSPDDLVDLEAIAHENNAGGITAIAFHLTDFLSHVSINTPGNSEVLKADIEAHAQDGSRVYLAGHSVGGGDVQNLLRKLKDLDLPVLLSAQLDSIEAGDDATIPDNTRLALGFYQRSPLRRGMRNGLFCLRGEDSLVPDDPSKTTVINQQINDPLPQGPSNPEKEGCAAYHRNMDNDDRVWKDSILERIQEMETSAAVYSTLDATSQPEDLQAEDLIKGLSATREARVRRDLRRQLALLASERESFDLILSEYRQAQEEELHLQLQSVVSEADSARIIARVRKEATRTTDEALFVALVYSLRKAGTREAKEALLQLVENNALVSAQQGITAIYKSLFDVVRESDSSWLLPLVKATQLSDEQLYIISRLARRFPLSATMLHLQEALVSAAVDRPVRHKISRFLARMKAERVALGAVGDVPP